MNTAARLRARVTLQEPVRTEDDIGGGAIDWISRGDVWAEIVTTGAAASPSYDGGGARASYRLEIRKRSDVKPGWRAIWNGRLLAIRATSDASGGLLSLSCDEEFL